MQHRQLMLYPISAAQLPARASLRFRKFSLITLVIALLMCGGAATLAHAQGYERELDAPGRVELRVKNREGRVTVIASGEQKGISVRANSPGAPVTERDVRVAASGGVVSIDVEREAERKKVEVTGLKRSAAKQAALERERIDITVRVPERAKVHVETEGGAVDVVGNVSSAEVQTDTGTIRADVPLDALHYSFHWTLSRPRFFSEVELPKIKQKRGGAYEISGRFGDKKAKQDTRIELDLTTARGVVLFGVSDAAMVPSDLRERALTEAARAIIRSGDQDLTGAIRKVAPRLVGDYTQTLPPRGTEPTLTSARRNPFNVRIAAGQNLARLQASVTDHNGRAIGGLSEKDFAVFEDGQERGVKDVTQSSAPFNLVLLLDVSGSVEERLDFIRKAALNFINTVSSQDRVAIISFRDDVQLISDFTTDRRLLAERTKSIQAGGATALYDSLGYTLVHTLKPLRGERTAIVVLSDGDDNRSFIPFPTILEAIIESGALVYPLYIPSGLIPASSAAAPESTLDPMRARFLTLTSRADEEGRKLASVSGGVYYPITRLEQLQRAYDDVVAQLRTAYTITYESGADVRREARIRVRVARDGASVRLSPAIAVEAKTTMP
ncbi:MAG: VWA domain-containing protein [Acidobacteria bacterium]|nr:VWA domain-containing protein [Acidobacteriota bacterium]